jgi:ferrous iron transport protein A
VTLNELTLDRPAAIVGVGGPVPLAQRLLSMGFLPGTPVRIVQVAPFGDPITIELDGWRVSLRRSEASLLEVKEDAR